jgi:hypothetical protein
MEDVDKDVHAINFIHGLHDLESRKVKNPGGKVLGGRINNDADLSRVWGSPKTYGRKIPWIQQR